MFCFSYFHDKKYFSIDDQLISSDSTQTKIFL